MILVTVDDNVLLSLAGLYGILIIASLISVFLKKTNIGKDYTELVQRINSWWLMVTIFTLAMILSRNVSLIFFGFIKMKLPQRYFKNRTLII